jgi:hypothetical protein
MPFMDNIEASDQQHAERPIGKKHGLMPGTAYMAGSVLGVVFHIGVLLYCQCRLDTWVKRLAFREEFLSHAVFVFSPLSLFFLSVSFLACLYWRKRAMYLAICIVLFLAQSASALFLSLSFPPALFILTLFLFLIGGLIAPLAPSTKAIAIALAVLIQYIAMPNIDDASIRSAVSRVQSDMRSLATAVEAYCVDTGAYPSWTAEPGKRLAFRSDAPLPSFRRYEEGGAMSLTTPVSFITRYPSDPFHKDGEDRTFSYYAPDDLGWILLSAGPNCVFDVDFETLKKVYDPARENPTPELLALTYDPTNGAVSAGDIWRVMQ